MCETLIIGCSVSLFSAGINNPINSVFILRSQKDCRLNFTVVKDKRKHPSIIKLTWQKRPLTFLSLIKLVNFSFLMKKRFSE